MTNDRAAGRLNVSLCALALAVAICAYERHFSLSFSDPHSFRAALDHRCGWVLLLSSLWAGAEIVAGSTRHLLAR